MSLKSIKNKIRSVAKTRQVTKAMESVAAVKMRKSQEQAFNARPYALHVFGILKRISKSVEGSLYSLMTEREVKHTCVVLITSDKGLAGNLNNAVIKEALLKMKEDNLNKKNTSFICIGKKGYEYFSKRGFEIRKYFDKIGDNASVEMLKELSDLIVSLYESEECDKFIIVYTNFISTTEQSPVSRVVLPVCYDEVKKIVKYILPRTGKYSEFRKSIDIDTDDVASYIFEPSEKEVLNELIPFLLNIQVYYSLLEAKASEHSARMIAMKNASDKAEEIKKELNLEFNKARQASITKEISEITGGIEALAS